jgi:hypothetical protein
MAAYGAERAGGPENLWPWFGFNHHAPGGGGWNTLEFDCIFPSLSRCNNIFQNLYSCFVRAHLPGFYVLGFRRA